MKRIILSVVAISTLSAALVGCGFRTSEPYLDKDSVVVVSHYDGRVVLDKDLVVYRKDPHHVFVYNGVKYQVKSHHNKYVYYRI